MLLSLSLVCQPDNTVARDIWIWAILGCLFMRLFVFVDMWIFGYLERVMDMFAGDGVGGAYIKWLMLHNQLNY